MTSLHNQQHRYCSHAETAAPFCTDEVVEKTWKLYEPLDTNGKLAIKKWLEETRGMKTEGILNLDGAGAVRKEIEFIGGNKNTRTRRRIASDSDS